MILYSLITIYQIIGYLRSNSFILVYVFAVLLLITAGFRGEAGFDIDRYYTNWWLPASDDWMAFKKEPVLHIFFGILNKVNIGFSGAIFIVAFISIIVKTHVFIKLSPLPFWCILIYYGDYFYFQDMGQIRSGMAMSFVLVSYYYLLQLRTKYYLTFWILASLTHISCLPTIILFFLHRTIKRPYSLFFIIGMLLLTVGVTILIPLDSVLTLLFGALGISGVYADYLLTRVGYEASNSFGSLGELLSLSILLLSWHYFKSAEANSTRDFFFVTYFIGFLFLVLSITYGELFARIARNFLISSVFILPFLYECTPKDRVNYVSLYILVLVYVNLKISLIFLKRSAELIPHGLL